MVALHLTSWMCQWNVPLSHFLNFVAWIWPEGNPSLLYRKLQLCCKSMRTEWLELYPLKFPVVDGHNRLTVGTCSTFCTLSLFGLCLKISLNLNCFWFQSSAICCVFILDLEEGKRQMGPRRKFENALLPVGQNSGDFDRSLTFQEVLLFELFLL